MNRLPFAKLATQSGNDVFLCHGVVSWIKKVVRYQYNHETNENETVTHVEFGHGPYNQGFSSYLQTSKEIALKLDIAKIAKSLHFLHLGDGARLQPAGYGQAAHSNAYYDADTETWRIDEFLGELWIDPAKVCLIHNHIGNWYQLNDDNTAPAMHGDKPIKREASVMVFDDVSFAIVDGNANAWQRKIRQAAIKKDLAIENAIKALKE